MEEERIIDELNALFATEDATYPADPFVGEVMRPIRRGQRLRQAVLFGAGGLGVGAAGSQLLAWSGSLDVGSTLTDTTVVTLRELATGLQDVPMMWALGGVLIIACIAMAAALERA